MPPSPALFTRKWERLTLDLAVAALGFDRAAERLGFGNRAGKGLQAVDRAAIGRALKDAMAAALQSLDAAGQSRPAGFSLLACGIGPDLDADRTGAGLGLIGAGLFAIDARGWHRATAGDAAFHSVAFGHFEAGLAGARDLLAARFIGAHFVGLVRGFDRASVCDHICACAIAGEPQH